MVARDARTRKDGIAGERRRCAPRVAAAYRAITLSRVFNTAKDAIAVAYDDAAASAAPILP